MAEDQERRQDDARSTDANWKLMAQVIPIGVIAFRLAFALLEVAVVAGGHFLPVFLESALVVLRPYCPLLACAVAFAVVLSLQKRMRLRHVWATIALWVVALLPIHLDIARQISFPTNMDELPPHIRSALERGFQPEPVSLAYRLLEGDQIATDAFLTNEHVQKAEAVRAPGGMYQIALRLNEAGARALANATKGNVGKQIAVFLDGELRCSAKIRTPLEGPDIMLPIREPQPTARQIAEGIMLHPEAETTGN